jgi:hypothetical protein
MSTPDREPRERTGHRFPVDMLPAAARGSRPSTSAEMTPARRSGLARVPWALASTPMLMWLGAARMTIAKITTAPDSPHRRPPGSPIGPQHPQRHLQRDPQVDPQRRAHRLGYRLGLRLGRGIELVLSHRARLRGTYLRLAHRGELRVEQLRAHPRVTRALHTFDETTARVDHTLQDAADEINDTTEETLGRASLRAWAARQRA